MKRVLLTGFLSVVMLTMINTMPASAGWEKTRQGWVFKDADYGYCLIGQNIINGQTYYFDNFGILDESRLNNNLNVFYKSYLGKYSYEDNNYSYNIVVKNIEKNVIMFNIQVMQLHSNCTNEAEVISILSGNNTDFEWFDSYGNNGSGKLSLEDNRITINMQQKYTIEKECITLKTKGTMALKRVSE